MRLPELLEDVEAKKKLLKTLKKRLKQVQRLVDPCKYCKYVWKNGRCKNCYVLRECNEYKKLVHSLMELLIKVSLKVRRGRDS